MLETGINIIEWPPLQYCTMSAFGGDALQRKAMSHKSSFIIIDEKLLSIPRYVYTGWLFSRFKTRVHSSQSLIF